MLHCFCIEASVLARSQLVNVSIYLPPPIQHALSNRRGAVMISKLDMSDSDESIYLRHHEGIAVLLFTSLRTKCHV